MNKKEIRKVFLESIILVEQKLRKTTIYTDEDNYRYNSKIDEVMQYLDGRFLKCHQSYIINLDKVVRMHACTIIFENGIEIALGRDCFTAAKQRYAVYIVEMAKKNLARGLYL